MARSEVLDLKFFFVLILKILFPGWQFFRTLGPELKLRVLTQKGWIESHELFPRANFLGLWMHNPQGNFFLYLNSRLERKLLAWDEKAELAVFFHQEFRRISDLVEAKTSEKVMGLEFEFSIDGQSQNIRSSW
jgi:hypothetical protein